jgi:division protein 1
MAQPNIAHTSPAGAVLANAVGNPNKSSRRRRGPAFLPSEHDELPKDVAFVVSPSCSSFGVRVLIGVDPCGSYGADNGVGFHGAVWDVGDGWAG